MLLFLKNLLFTILVPGMVAVLIPYRIGLRRGMPTSPWTLRQSAALLPLVIGATIYVRCVWDFARTGRGTPAPIDAPRVLVVRGLYEYVRNPIYIGILLIVLGWSVYFGSARLVLYAAALAIVFHVFVVLVEEPTLRRHFGESYERYCRDVRRWLPGKRFQPAAMNPS
jgi:protein-S-isoprenylcysteine O-methyltransferase Ste14